MCPLPIFCNSTCKISSVCDTYAPTTQSPTTGAPSAAPTINPSRVPSQSPSFSPSSEPSSSPSRTPSQLPSLQPTQLPSFSPSIVSNQPNLYILSFLWCCFDLYIFFINSANFSYFNCRHQVKSQQSSPALSQLPNPVFVPLGPPPESLARVRLSALHHSRRARHLKLPRKRPLYSRLWTRRESRGGHSFYWTKKSLGLIFFLYYLTACFWYG